MEKCSTKNIPIVENFPLIFIGYSVTIRIEREQVFCKIYLFKFLKNTSEIKEKLDNLQKMLDQVSSECVLIKDQIEEGFEGTDAELRQIKEKIDNIEQDLDNLVQISNDVGGKEGECIRKFASQMLELMKKGDSEALKRFSEKIVQNSSSIEEIIEAAKIPEREESRSKI